MHVPDGFLDAPTSVATGVVAAVGIGLALRGARRELDDRTAPLAGLVATFIFATQMLNFPVGAGTSGHLLGGALAAVLVGPATALLCMSVVFLVQCLLFADGGITALGTNIFLMGIVTVVVGWAVFRGLQMVLPQRVSSVPAAAAGAALVSVPVAALAFVGLYAVGGTVDIPLASLTTAMLERARADRAGRGRDHVPGRRQHRRGPARPRVRRPAGAGDPVAGAADGRPVKRPVSTRLLVVAGVLVALLLAGVASFYASGDPDGLTKVSEDQGFAQTEKEHQTGDGPLAGYETKGVADGRLSGGLAGVLGSLVVLTIAGGGALVVRRRRTSAEA